MGSCTVPETDKVDLSREEALTFIRQKLLLEISDSLSPNDSTTLQNITQQFGRRFAFSTLPFLCLPIDQRGLPTPAEVKTRGLRMLGGNCYDSNVFLHFLLEALGYEVYFVMGKFCGSINEHHVFNVVHFSSGEICLADAGSIPPVFENLVDLSFAGETSPTFKASLWHVRFQRDARQTPEKIPTSPGKGSGQSFVGSCKWIDGDDHPTWRAPLMDDGWKMFSEFTLRYRTFAEVNEEVNLIYHDSPQLAPVLDRVLIARYSEGRLIMVRNATVIRDHGNGQSTEERFTSLQEVHDKITEYFGDIIEDKDIRLALQTAVELKSFPPSFVPADISSYDLTKKFTVVASNAQS